MLKRLFSNNVFKTSLFFIGVILLLFNVNPLLACKIEFKVLGEEKEIYKVDDIIDVKLTVVFSHRVCPIAIRNTDSDTNGLEIIEETEWKEIRGRMMIYERELKLKVKGNKEGKLTLSVIRKCDLGGGSGSITFKSKPVEKT